MTNSIRWLTLVLMEWRQAALASARIHTRGQRQTAHKHTYKHTHTHAASPHLRNVTGLLLHSKPTGALNKHLFLPVNPPLPPPCCLHGSPLLRSPLRGNIPPHSPHPPSSLKGIYTLTFGIQIKKRGQAEAERITGGL